MGNEHIKPTDASELSSERVAPKELITPDAIKARVMQFFPVELKKEGSVSKVGLFTITTRPLPRFSNFEHIASVNGFEVAKYRHIDPDTLPPLPEGWDRETATYTLRGVASDIDGDDIEVSLIEYERRVPEIIIKPPASWDNTDGLNYHLEEFGNGAKAFIAHQLGLNVEK